MMMMVMCLLHSVHMIFKLTLTRLFIHHLADHHRTLRMNAVAWTVTYEERGWSDCFECNFSKSFIGLSTFQHIMVIRNVFSFLMYSEINSDQISIRVRLSLRLRVRVSVKVRNIVFKLVVSVFIVLLIISEENERFTGNDYHVKR